jgi:hypothetical protein
MDKEIDMKSPAADYVTLVEVLELTGSQEEFVAAGQAMARRLEAEGIPSLVSVHLYADPGSTEAGVVLTFADPGEMMRHIEMIAGWEEFARFVTTVRPIDVRVYGKLTPEAEEWLRHMNVVGKKFENHVAGFVR